MEVQSSNSFQSVTKNLFEHEGGSVTSNGQRVALFMTENRDKLSASDLMDFSSRLESRILEIEDDKTGIKGFFLNLFFPQKIVDKDSEVKVLKEVRDLTAKTFSNQMSSYSFKNMETSFFAHKDSGVRLLTNCETISKYLINHKNRISEQELQEFSSHLGSRIKEIEDNNTSGIRGFFQSLFFSEEENTDIKTLEKLKAKVENTRILITLKDMKL